MSEIVFRLTSSLRRSLSDAATIKWPVIKVTEKRAGLVDTPGGELWLSPSDRLRLRDFWILQEDKLALFLKVLRQITGGSNNSLVEVERAGKGPTAKSHKFRIKVWRHNGDRYEPSEDLVVRTLTLPLSLVVEIDGKLFLPVWCIRKRLPAEERVIGNWQGLSAVEKQFAAEFKKVSEEDEKNREISRVRHIQAKHEAEQLEKVRIEREAIRSKQLSEAPPPKPKKIRHPDKILQNCNVDFIEWQTRKGRTKKIEHSYRGCLVECFGAKRVITTPDGDIIVKLLGNYLKITPQEITDRTPSG